MWINGNSCHAVYLFVILFSKQQSRTRYTHTIHALSCLVLFWFGRFPIIFHVTSLAQGRLINSEVQTDAVMTPSSVAWYCIQHSRHQGRTKISICNHTKTPYRAVTDELWGICCVENSPLYTDIAPYVDEYITWPTVMQWCNRKLL